MILRKRKKALLIGVNYTKLPKTKGRLIKPHDDVAIMKKLLVELYDYDPNDIIVMTDDEKTPEYLQPTKVNMVEQMINLVIAPNEGDEFFFYYAGHAVQDKEKKLHSERDGKDEYILPVDAMNEEGSTVFEYAIQDDELRELLVKPLVDTQIKCQLIAVMDSCTSGTLLDLEHDLCNQVIGVKSRFFRVIRKILETSPGARSRIRARIANSSCFRDEHFKCNQLCNRKATPRDKANVICISACKDSQVLIEAVGKNTLAGLLNDYLRTKDKRPTLKELVRFIYNELNETHKLMWTSYKEEEGKFKTKQRSNAPTKPPKKRDKPQISSSRPLRMNTLLKL